MKNKINIMITTAIKNDFSASAKRVEEDGKNLNIFMPSSDPNYEIKITLHDVQYHDNFSLPAGAEDAIGRLVHAVKRAVEEKFPQTKKDPTKWGAFYNPRTKQSFVQCKGDESRVGEPTVAKADRIALMQEDATNLSALRARSITHVSHALEEIYTEVAPEGVAQVSNMGVTPRRKVVPSAPSLTSPITSSNHETPTAPSAPAEEVPTSMAPSAPAQEATYQYRGKLLLEGLTNLFRIFNAESETLQAEFSDSFLGRLRWQDLLHKNWHHYRDNGPVGAAVDIEAAEVALRHLVDHPEEDTQMRRWLIAIAKATKPKWQYESLVEWLVQGYLGKQPDNLINVIKSFI